MASSNITAANGQIDVNGQPVQLRGINIYSDDLRQQGAAAVINTFPGINLLRVNVFDLNADSAAALKPYVDQLTSNGVVVEIEDHNYPTVLTGSGLQAAAQWYASLATTFAGNSNVIFGTQNEPDLSSGWGAVDTEIKTIYNAIRSTGNQNLILMNAAGGYTTDGLNPSTYASMTNVAWDLHYYNWMANNSTSLSANVQALQSEVAGAEATDNIPVVIGEYGNASGALGANYDPGGMQVVQAVEQSGLSSAAWAWTSGDPSFPLLLSDGWGNPSYGLTQFGQMTQQFIAAGGKVPPASGGGTSTGSGGTSTGSGSSSTAYITPGTGSFKDAAGNTYTLDAAGNALENGSPIPGGSGTAEMALYNGTVYGEDRNSSQWYSWNQSTWAAASAPPPPSSGTSSSGTGSSTPPATGGTGSSTPPATGGTGGTTTGSSTTYITPGSGSFKDAAGNTYTLDAAGNAMENGSPMPGGSGTKEMAYYNGTVYGEDGSTSQWYTWNQSTWSATAAPPPASGGTSGTGSSTPPAVTGAGSDSLVIKLSEDAYKGDAQFTVKVDGKQLGGTFTATALHSSSNSQAFAFAGDFGAGSHTVTVTFLNDLYAGTASTDRNLYVNDVIYKGVDTGKSATLLAAGSKAFAVTGGTTPSVAETGDHGSLTKNLSQTGTYKVGGDTFVLTSGNAAAVTLGTGTSQIKFLGAGSVTLTGGSGQATVNSDIGNNSFAAGSGSLDVTGGAGKDAYVYHSTSGMLVVEDFSLAKGDTLTIDKSLQGSFHQGADGTGGSMLTFGSTNHGIDLHGVATLASSNIHWV